jgi:sugar phosphate isomerase/epimerase
VKQAGPLLKALHIADNEGAYDQHLMPYGRGNIRWDRFMAALNERAYDGLFNFEIPGESTAPLEIKKAKLRYIKEMAEYMAGIR